MTRRRHASWYHVSAWLLLTRFDLCVDRDCVERQTARLKELGSLHRSMKSMGHRDYCMARVSRQIGSIHRRATPSFGQSFVADGHAASYFSPPPCSMAIDDRVAEAVPLILEK